MPKKRSRLDNDLPVPVQLIERRIYLIRGQKVMLDRDLAELYQVKPIALRQQVKRNMDRFPEDFMFQLTEKEAALLVSQSVIPSTECREMLEDALHEMILAYRRQERRSPAGNVLRSNAK